MVKLKQFLKTRIIKNKYLYVDYWSILHLILFFIIGFYFPNKWMIIIVGSLIFEFSEKIVAARTPFLRETMKDKISDLGFNFIGYWLGINYGGLILGGII